MDATVVNLWTLFEQLVRRLEIISEGSESIEFIQVVKDFEDFRKKCQRTNQELEKFKDLLLKAETGRSALDVKLKHARNQVDVEIKRRQRAEAECAKLEQQIQLIRDILMCDTSGSIQLSEEQKSALAFLNRGRPSSGNPGNNRLSTIDESGSILSDISFDKTDESLRSNSRQFIDGPPGPVKKTCSIGSTVDQVSGVIKPESCVPCGKRIKFGKLSLKCRDCRLVSHPECRDRCPLPCISPLVGTPVKIGEGMLADFVSQTSPMIPAIVVSCVNEIEQRGLTEVRVDSRQEIADEDNSTAAMYQAISELPQANRDTLAFLMIHLQRFGNKSKSATNLGQQGKFFPAPYLK
ncbi:hypothetical protein A6R68_18105 [Neotoma lepida]|uniref:Phorbol-ester/DAG-type domain-containing protein n=1 Tax=Neotoma lepida TaxID=56216 RepID=A0A1A6HND5_NEOLE|nr:hypothetical protein A6R68_18105 [Neotoma lepida]